MATEKTKIVQVVEAKEEKQLVQVVKADDVEEEEEDLVDPLETLREECREKEKCIKMKDRLDACSARVEDGSEESCHEEMMDFVHCVDHCAAKKLFSKLK